MRVWWSAPLAGGLMVWGSVAQGTLIISEYVEGSGSNKAIELYNHGPAELDLSNYTLELYSNGSEAVSRSRTLEGMLEPGTTLVLANGNAGAALTMYADVIDNQLINHNGDDAFVLRRGAEVIDRFGRVGERPAVGYWGSAEDNTRDHTLRRKLSVLVGDADYTGAFDPAVEWDFFSNDTFDGLGWHGESGGEPEPNPPVELGACGEPFTRISAVQGSTDTSPLVGQVHEIEAVVTAVFPRLSGFFVMAEPRHRDNDPNTSEGLFVFQSNFTVTPGQQVRVRGTVSEYFGQTQISAQQVAVCAGQVAIEPVTFSLPLDNPEALESMLVQVPAGLTVSDVYDLGRYGSITLSQGRLMIPTHVAEQGEPAAAVQAHNDRHQILLDDGSNEQNPEQVIYPQGGLSAENTLRVGDTAEAFTAILSYGFDAWRLQPVGEVSFAALNERPEPPARHPEANLRVAAFNVLNFFNGDGSGGGFPTSRGARNAVELERQRDKLVAALQALDADIIGVMEIENDGYGERSAVAELAGALGASWRFVDPGLEQLGSDEIAVGLLYRSDVVEEAGTAAAVSSGAFSAQNRVPVAQAFRLLNGDEAIVVAVNHFKSKGCGGAEGLNADQDDGASCWNPVREQAATELQQWLAGDPTGLGEQGARIMVIGDLNAYAKERPVRLLEQAGYRNLLSHFRGDDVYSYVYFGQTGYLDHVLASDALKDKVVDAGAWAINADEPRVLDYSTQFKQPSHLTAFYAPDAFRSSDHDPVYADLRLLADDDGESGEEQPGQGGRRSSSGGAVGAMLGLLVMLLGTRRRRLI